MLILFLTIQTPKRLVLSTLSMINVSHLDNPLCLLASPLPLGTSMPQHINTNAITNKNTNTIITQFQEDAYVTAGAVTISPQMHYARIENM